jgi:acetate kinase
VTDRALILNAGSSSLKFQAYARPDEEWTVELSGQIEGLGSAPKLKVRDGASAVVHEAALPPVIRDGRAAFDVLAGWLHEHYGGATLSAVGHRVVHGGTKYAKACIVTPEVIADLRALIPLAPLHQPHNVSAIEAVAERLPRLPQVACFDTAFHRTMPAVAQLVPLTDEIRAAGVQRYGFHGLSYEYIASALPTIAPSIAEGRVIVAHLGSGASLCAMKKRQSVDCTFGFTPLDGLCMGTRPGSIDPGVILHLFQTLHLSADDVEKILYKKSGLLGISGISNDMRDLEENADPRAKLAVGYFVYQVIKHAGALAAVLGGVEAIVFTAGIGEHSSIVRRRICEGLSWLGIDLDAAANDRHATQISKPNSRVSAWVIPTNEELMIARHTGDLLGLRQPATASAAQRRTS